MPRHPETMVDRAQEHVEYKHEEGLAEDQSGALIKHELIGHEIRHTFRSALALTKSDLESGGKMKWEHIDNVLQRTLELKQVRALHDHRYVKSANLVTYLLLC